MVSAVGQEGGVSAIDVQLKYAGLFDYIQRPREKKYFFLFREKGVAYANDRAIIKTMMVYDKGGWSQLERKEESWLLMYNGSGRVCLFVRLYLKAQRKTTTFSFLEKK
jgi:hypothetical protein